MILAMISILIELLSWASSARIAEQSIVVLDYTSRSIYKSKVLLVIIRKTSCSVLRVNNKKRANTVRTSEMLFLKRVEKCSKLGSCNKLRGKKRITSL